MSRIVFIVLALTFAVTAPAPTMTYGTCSIAGALSGDNNPTRLVKIYFPNTKPGSRGKAYVWWRARTIEPDGVFDGTFMTREQLIQKAIEIGGFTVGKEVALTPRELPEPAAEISAARKKRLAEHYLSTTTVMATSEENLKPFRRTVDRAIERYGSLQRLLDANGIRMELTEAKRAALKRGAPRNRGGKYIIDSTGKTYFLTEEEMESLRVALGVENVNHGVMGAIIMASTGNREVAILDYGEVTLVPGRTPPQTLGAYQSHWNRGREFDTLAYLLEE